MILKLNHLQTKAAVTPQQVDETFRALSADGALAPQQIDDVRVELDWIQYRSNFREPVSLTQRRNGDGRSHGDLHIDTRRVEPAALRGEILRVLSQLNASTPCEDARVPLEEFASFRRSIAWEFNQLYWSHFTDWEQATGRGYEKALPGGQSDGHHPVSVADGVADFWTLLRDLDGKKQLPEELFFLEIGVGTGTRCGMWLNKFRELDHKRGTNYYPRLRVLLGDYSLATLDSSRPAVREHVDLCSFLVLDALHPLKTLSFLRNKILHVHTTNMYDNLPDEEIVRRDGRLYLVEVRSYLPMEDARRISAAADVPLEKIRATVAKLLETGPDHFHNPSLGMVFWQEVWAALRLEERLVPLDDLAESPLPAGLDAAVLNEILQRAPADLRFHVSSGAYESFTNTLPLLHPRGYMQVQDIFVTDFKQYEKGFWGPGKLDGSVVNWVNGALLKAVGERAGYDVHFAPFTYRKDSKTSILYASRGH